MKRRVRYSDARCIEIQLHLMVYSSFSFVILMFQFISYYDILYSNRVMNFRWWNQKERIRDMPASNNNKKMHNKKAARRNRVNRLKSLIVLAAVILLFSSVILNFLLVFKVLKLEEQVDKLYSQNNVVVTQDILYM